MAQLENHQSLLSGKVIGQSLGTARNTVSEAIAHHHDIDAFMDKQLLDNVMNLIAINHLAEYMADVESGYNDSEWMKFKRPFFNH